MQCEVLNRSAQEKKSVVEELVLDNHASYYYKTRVLENLPYDYGIRSLTDSPDSSAIVPRLGALRHPARVFAQSTRMPDNHRGRETQVRTGGQPLPHCAPCDDLAPVRARI